MNILVISNIFPTDHNPDIGTYVAEQVRSLNSYIKQKLVYKKEKTLKGFVSFQLTSVCASLKKNYDMIHAHFGFHSALVPMLCTSTPMLVTFHGSDALLLPATNPLFSFAQRYVVTHATHIIAVSKSIQAKLVSDLGADPQKISLIPCGIDTNRFTPMPVDKIRQELGLKGDEKIALFIGRLTELKGVDVIQTAARRLSNVKFYLIGDGPIRWELENTRFIGKINNSEIPKWINAANVLLLPSQSEGTPVAVLEALSCETPVICSRVGACPELIEDGVTGLLIPPDDPETLVHALQSAFDQITFQTNIGRKLVIEQYRIEEISKELLKLYVNILNGEKL